LPMCLLWCLLWFGTCSANDSIATGTGCWFKITENMNKIITTCLAAGALVLGAQKAHALTFSDADSYNAGLGQTIGVGGVYADSFNISSPDGTASFTVTPNYGPLGLAGSTFTSNPTFNHTTQTLDGSGTASFWISSVDSTDVATVVLDDLINGTHGGNSVYVNLGNLSATVIADLQADGSVTYTVANTGLSPITLDYSLLIINGSNNPPPTTPDGGATAMLLGMGFLGAAGIRRKLS